MSEPMVSEEDARRRERAAFVEGACYWASGWAGIPQDEAIRRYPIKKKVPRTIRVWRVNGDEVDVRVIDGEFYTRRVGAQDDFERQYAAITPANIRRMNALLDDPYEEVDE